MAFWGINCGLSGPLAKHFPSVFLQENGTKIVAEIRTRMADQVRHSRQSERVTYISHHASNICSRSIAEVHN